MSGGLGVLSSDEPESPDALESARLDLEEREVGMAGAIAGSTTCVLRRFWELKSHPAPGPSGSRLAGRDERLVLGVSETSRIPAIPNEHEVDITAPVEC